MSLRFALLALLTAQPMTGYDLAKAFHSSVGHVWHAPNSQIYPELRKMEHDGLILGEIVAWGTRGRKTLYEVTPEGDPAFREWIATPLGTHAKGTRPICAPPTSSGRMRESAPQLRAHREHYGALRAQWAEQLELIRTRQHPVVRRRLEVFPESEWARIIAFKGSRTKV